MRARTLHHATPRHAMACRAVPCHNQRPDPVPPYSASPPLDSLTSPSLSELDARALPLPSAPTAALAALLAAALACLSDRQKEQKKKEKKEKKEKKKRSNKKGKGRGEGGY